MGESQDCNIVRSAHRVLFPDTPRHGRDAYRSINMSAKAL